jgi:lipoate-protein ligase A
MNSCDSGNRRHTSSDIDEIACAHEGIEILRRYSGGGTVLQGPGCLNYALILKTTPGPPLSSITGTTRYVLQRNARALRPLLRKEITPMGDSDLTAGGLKFSGNAQRRLGHAVLFHGTLLLNFDIPLTGRYLRIPDKQPAYREHRGHEDFMGNIRIEATEVKQALREEWGAAEKHPGVTAGELQDLIDRKYGRRDWVFRM